MQEIPHRNNDIDLYNRSSITIIEQFNDMRKLLLAKIGTETHKFTIGKNTNNFELASSLKIQYYLLNNADPFVNKRIFNNSFG